MRTERVSGWALLAFVALAIFLGGASGRGAGAAANGLLQLVALGLILLVLWSRRDPLVPVGGRWPALIISLFVLWVLATLIPLPPGFWEALPGREPVAQGFRSMGMDPPALPLSLASQRTLDSLLWVLPPVAAFLLTLRCRAEHRHRLAWLLLALAGVSVVLGAAQLLGGQQSPLRFYSVTNRNLPVGFFSNANHLATLLLCTLPLAGHLAARGATRSTNRAQRGSSILMSASVAVFILIGIAMIGSLAGFGLALPAAAASFLIYRRAAAGGLGNGWIAGLLVATLFFVGYGLAGPVARQSLSGDLGGQPSSRMTFAATTVQAIGDTFPVGTGMGSFAEVYRTYEDPDVADREFVNHAHNDYLEVALELGLPGVILVLAFIGWWAWQSRLVWRSDFPGSNLARAASVIILIVLLHSIVDYPLRTSAMATVFAVACGLLIPPPASKGRKRQRSAESSARHLEAD